MKLFIYLCISVFICSSGNAGDKHRFFNMNPFQIDSLLSEIAASDMTITGRMAFFSTYFLDTPYSFTCVGDGPYALYEPFPLVNFKQTNCMAFCEHVLALSVSDSWDHFFNNLQMIRYQDGMIGMRTRNHYTMGDWLPQNSWLLEDVSRVVGGERTKTVTRMISHRRFFEGKGIKDLRHVKADRQLTVDYIPSGILNDVKSNFQNGDIGALIYANKTDIFSAHMFMIFNENGRLIIRESSTSRNTTFDSEYDQWVKTVQKRERYIGIAVMRVRSELNSPGRVIHPAEISRLKTLDREEENGIRN